jgi:inosine/xanthosine triphosphate pyrophosphatase family protein
MVFEEVISAYSQLKIPCIVEHAGLIFSEYADKSYPGGLTKPMWDTLQDRFVDETKSAGRSAIARAVVAYCDGKQVKTFVGERAGTIADRPRGSREFYWDTVFIPEDPSGRCNNLTYAEIVERADLGLAYKIRELSQSSTAIKSFLEYCLKAGEPELWR